MPNFGIAEIRPAPARSKPKSLFSVGDQEGDPLMNTFANNVANNPIASIDQRRAVPMSWSHRPMIPTPKRAGRLRPARVVVLLSVSGGDGGVCRPASRRAEPGAGSTCCGAKCGDVMMWPGAGTSFCVVFGPPSVAAAAVPAPNNAAPRCPAPR